MLLLLIETATVTVPETDSAAVAVVPTIGDALTDIEVFWGDEDDKEVGLWLMELAIASDEPESTELLLLLLLFVADEGLLLLWLRLLQLLRDNDCCLSLIF